MAVQAISGVSPSSEAVVMMEYPSLASTGIGRLLGWLYELVPIRPFGLMKVSYVFALLTMPLGLPLYFLQKVFGQRYVLTNRNVQVWTARKTRMVSSVALADVVDVELKQWPGQVFYNASDIRLKSASGETKLTLKGVKDAGAFKNAIACAVDSRRMVQESMAQIAARS
ncbi:MAG: PH domain-containing protein [Fuerstiella sp.]|nr:PH domain-containing protein [Fuerstiella sp.]MCP4787576.1 PH domain-containing protein [Fuerstiella sp.]MCP4855506.1 PH domain-containing protein [Fuerstiella sp.]